MFTYARTFWFSTSSVALLVASVALSSGAQGQTQVSNRQTSRGKQPITVVDAVGITRLEAPDPFAGSSSIAHFSPDGKRFAVVVRKGNLEKNANEFSLRLYNSAEVFHSRTPDIMVEMSSTSNRPAITKVRWLADNETLVFLGEKPDELSQVYSFNVITQRLAKLTHHSTAVSNYDVTQDGHIIAFEAAPLDRGASRRAENGKEVVVTNQEFADLMTGEQSQPVELFWQVTGQSPRQLPVGEEYSILGWSISLSPDGRYVVFPANVRNPSPEWSSYQEPLLQQVLAANIRKGAVLPVGEYLIFDTANMSLAPIVRAPRIGSPPVTWANDGQAVFLSSFLPLDVADATERKARERSMFPIEVRLPGREYHKVSKDKFPTSVIQKPPIEVTLTQDLNVPPKLYVSDSKSQQKVLLLDLNPQFEDLDFGTVDTVEWNVDGVDLIAGLYLPPDYAPGRRYPLLIQTHGFVPGEFSMDGRSEWGSAFAARALAAKGVMVLQLPYFKDHAQIDKVENNRNLGATVGDVLTHFWVRAAEAVIDKLDKQNLIDRNRVGISGFSRWVCFVGYVLTHSKYHFAAASLVDGISCGYFEEIAHPEYGWDIDNLMGGSPPIGEGLGLWMKNSPGFNLDKVQVPVQLAALGTKSIISAWEWYVGLSIQKKPVDFVYVPNAVHIAEKLSDRRSRQQHIVDWFRFWLKGDQDPDPAKADQYKRWRELRKLQEQNQKNATVPPK